MSEVLLPSGETLTDDEVIHGFLLLARNQAPFPILSTQDAQLACMLLMLVCLGVNAEEGVI